MVFTHLTHTANDCYQDNTHRIQDHRLYLLQGIHRFIHLPLIIIPPRHRFTEHIVLPFAERPRGRRARGRLHRLRGHDGRRGKESVLGWTETVFLSTVQERIAERERERKRKKERKKERDEYGYVFEYHTSVTATATISSPLHTASAR